MYLSQLAQISRFSQMLKSIGGIEGDTGMTETVSITTATDGSATVYSSAMSGVVTGIIITIGTLTAGQVDFTITGETTGQTLLVVSNLAATATYQPVRLQYINTTGASAGVYGPISIPNERVKIVVAAGGNASTGSVQIICA